MKVMKCVILLLALAPWTATASRGHYQDNKGLLYCQVVCTVDGTSYKDGLYPLNHQATHMKVRGKWTTDGLTISLRGKYSVSPEVLGSAKKICESKRSELFNLKQIKALIEESTLSGIDESKCRVYPRITTELGAAVFEMKIDESFENDKTDL